MKNFDLYSYFHDQLLKEQEEDENEAPQNHNQFDPTQVAQDQSMVSQNAVQNSDQTKSSTPQQNSPAQQTQIIKAGSDHFSILKGQTIKHVEFDRSPKDVNFWELKIFIEDYQLPFIFTSVNGRIRIQTPDDGEVYPIT